jgi:hypothetical protein
LVPETPSRARLVDFPQGWRTNDSYPAATSIDSVLRAPSRFSLYPSRVYWSAANIGPVREAYAGVPVIS